MLQHFLSVLSRGTISSATFSNLNKEQKYLMLLSRNRENLKNILLSVYGNKEAVDDDLVEVRWFIVINSVSKFLHNFLG